MTKNKKPKSIPRSKIPATKKERTNRMIKIFIEGTRATVGYYRIMQVVHMKLKQRNQLTNDLNREIISVSAAVDKILRDFYLWGIPALEKIGNSVPAKYLEEESERIIKQLREEESKIIIPGQGKPGKIFIPKMHVNINQLKKEMKGG